jgi:uncharacterized protein DUF2867
MYTDPYILRIEVDELGGRQAGEVCEVELPPSARELTTLSRVDYTDAFVLTTPRGGNRTGEEWARAILEEAPDTTRRGLRRGWFVLGVALGATDDRRRVLGWPVRQSSPDHAVLAADSLMGMEAEVLVKRERGSLLVATLIKLNNPLARAIWTAFSPQHRRVVRHLLRQAGTRTA